MFGLEEQASQCKRIETGGSVGIVECFADASFRTDSCAGLKAIQLTEQDEREAALEAVEVSAYWYITWRVSFKPSLLERGHLHLLYTGALLTSRQQDVTYRQ